MKVGFWDCSAVLGVSRSSCGLKPRQQYNFIRRSTYTWLQDWYCRCLQYLSSTLTSDAKTQFRRRYPFRRVSGSFASFAGDTPFRKKEVSDTFFEACRNRFSPKPFRFGHSPALHG
eukprot:jgi/Botrbrau1/7529/Bobra.0019s0017.1